VSYQAVTLDAEACVRYYFEARHKVSLGNMEWDPVIALEKPIGGCGEKGLRRRRAKRPGGLKHPHTEPPPASAAFPILTRTHGKCSL